MNPPEPMKRVLHHTSKKEKLHASKHRTRVEREEKTSLIEWKSIAHT